MFAALAQMMNGGREPTAVSLAVWFHDIIYSPQNQDNEAQSAAIARSLLASFNDVGLLDEVARLILLTQTHQTEPSDENGRLLLDADLAILGSPRAVYQQYAQAIRREYAHVPDELYTRGRTAVLSQFQQTPQIFQTAYGQTNWEQAARGNLQWELSGYSGPA